MSAPSLNLLVFREGRRAVNGALRAGLSRHIQLMHGPFDPARALEALLAAGELESALADLDANLNGLAAITDSLADAIVNSQPIPDASRLLVVLDAALVPENLNLSVPEGFAYYALHPLAYADVLEQMALPGVRAAVIGIRTIGATLSAVTAAALRKRGLPAERITVRPVGHPYNRSCQFSPHELNFVNKEIAAGSSFLVVDEGPGLSGSSFLSVAEALARAGVPRESITVICSHVPRFEDLCAENVGERCRHFRWVAVPQEARRPSAAQIWIGGGEWRRRLLPQDSPWPASWLNLERLKYLSSGDVEPRFYKFLGLGHYGTEVFQREASLAAEGYAVPPGIESDGFASYPMVDGRAMCAADLTESVLAHLAEYCACRLYTLPADRTNLAALQEMAGHNLQQLKFNVPVTLQLDQPAIADGRMQPYEWLLTSDGTMLKTDCGSHGDDHFFPGAVDIAWDLAGAIVEWQMNPVAIKIFLEMYHRASGDDAEKRVADYIIAYTVFRCAYCRMAANAMRDADEHQRLESTAGFYGTRLSLNYQPAKLPTYQLHETARSHE